tara:strand:+ start:165 stop:347 length:183 start_codon:yes stop_codon:yes gene_type:complete
MINILHSKIKDQEEKINDQEKLLREKDLLIDQLRSEVETKNKIINLYEKRKNQLLTKLFN